MWVKGTRLPSQGQPVERIISSLHSTQQWEGREADSISITAFPVDSLSWLLHGRPGWIHTCIYIRRLLCALGSMSMLTVSAR